MAATSSPSDPPNSSFSTPHVVLPTAKHTHTVILLHGLGSSGPKFGEELLSTPVEIERPSLSAHESPSPSITQSEPTTRTMKTLPDLLPSTKFIFPTAPRRRVTWLHRSRVRAWFDVASIADRSLRPWTAIDGLREGVEHLKELIVQEEEELVRTAEKTERGGDEERTIGKQSRILLGGLSNGCAMALVAGLMLNGMEGEDGRSGSIAAVKKDHHERLLEPKRRIQLAGMVGLSGWLPLLKAAKGDEPDEGSYSDEDDDDDGIEFGCSDDEESKDKNSDDPKINGPHQSLTKAINALRSTLSLDAPSNPSAVASICVETPIFLGHGNEDEKVSCRLGRDAGQLLMDLGLDVAWKEYDGLGHWYNGQELGDLVRFLQDRAGFPVDKNLAA